MMAEKRTRRKAKSGSHLMLVGVLIFLLGIGLMGYPAFSEWWNASRQTIAISSYDREVASLDEADYKYWFDQADAYNQVLAQKPLTLHLTAEEQADYDAQLDIQGNGRMGYIEIPRIGEKLAIYHGTSESVLQSAVGHLEGTSLPVGGKGTHTVISGHRGLPTARLFTDITELAPGDVFVITVLNRKMTYEVDQILTVLPTELDALAVDPEKDLATLVTCTPYGVNSHRLLVRGHRIENLPEEALKEIPETHTKRELSLKEKINRAAPWAAGLCALLFAAALLMPSKKHRRKVTEKTG